MAAATLLLGSPGPAPLALAATGATYGARGGMPFLAGILSGLAVAIVVAATGLAALFELWPKLALSLQVLGALYITWIAWRIATAPVISERPTRGRQRPRFADGFLLNLLNPKAYAAFLALFSQFLLPQQPLFAAYLATGLCIFLTATVVDLAWLGLGSAIRPWFQRPLAARVIRVGFAVAMIGAVLWALWPR